MLKDILLSIISNKKGVEIGGPSHSSALDIYKNAEIIDNVIFNKNTVWSNHTEKYNYYANKSGKVIINDAVDIFSIMDETYDFCFSSHCLEHIANPLKAISEWLRIIKKEGYCIIIVPEKSLCFDHNRDLSNFETLLTQYNNNVSEKDLSTLPEILLKHDLSMDIPAGNFEQFKKRSLDNYNNRCLHHYVYSPKLLSQIAEYFNCDIIYTETIYIDIWFIMKKRF